jgi:HSP20 family molecular chaperone IbpA
MGFFDDDSFDNIVRDLFGNSTLERRNRRETIIKGEEEDRNIDFVETDNKIYLIFELPGYNEKDILVLVNGKELEITAKKINIDGVQDYLLDKLQAGSFFKRILPQFINPKKSSHTIRNGVLEIIFDKIK